MAYINGTYIFVEKEDVAYKITAASHPVEKGGDITDHVIKEPVKLSISGIITGPDTVDKVEKLRKIQDEGDLVKYDGRNVADNFLITDFSVDVDHTITGGCRFSMTLLQMRIAMGPTGTISAKRSFVAPFTEAWDGPKQEGDPGYGSGGPDGNVFTADGPVNTKETTEAGTQQVEKHSTTSHILHWVKKGETAYQIAEKYRSKYSLYSDIAKQIPGGPQYIEIGEALTVAARR